MTTWPRLWLPLCGALLIGMPLASQAQDYPTRPITVVVPFPAGGLTDVPARIAATMMSEKIGQNLVVENKTGATGTIGAAHAARATPDGYTLFANSLADAQNIHFVPLTYSPVDDFAQIGWIVDGPPVVLIINARLPYKSLAELLAAAKANPKNISFGTSGPASSPAMALAQLNMAAKTDIVAVPYRGSGDAAREVAGGAIQGVFSFISQAKPLVDDGKVRALAVAAPERVALWPDVPTFKELGYNVDFRGFVGLSAPAKTPKPIIDYLNKQLNAVVQSDAFKTRVGALGMTVPADNTPAKYDAFIREETVRQGNIAKLVKAASPAPPAK
ncbi:MAG: Bug family tripartite tricarboxylate transporter substrate binding protein [Xanthobacteraceae bacterium]